MSLPILEMNNIEQINEARDRLLKDDVKYRVVIHMVSLKK
jgi:D-arabinose 1-dehydrogenase-like Zn-dependent alcohol dehydrogenase